MKIIFLCGDAENPPAAGLWLKSMEKSVAFFSEKLPPEIAGKYDYMVSLGYRHIIKRNILNNMNGNAINMHISYLPYNRGADPNFWSIAEDTQSGVTIHVIDEGVDTGDIVVQRMLDFEDSKETLATAYDILQREVFELFAEVWPRLVAGEANTIPQRGVGSLHMRRDKEDCFKAFPLGWDTPLSELRGKLAGVRKRFMIVVDGEQ